MAVTGMVAAVYAAATIFMPIPQYGPIQCRLSEMMCLLAFINPVFAPGIVLGCFIANLFSPVSPVLDAIFGTLHSAIALLFITRFSKNMFVASLWPTVFCFIIGGMILFTSGMELNVINFGAITGSVMAGQFIAVTVVGYPLFLMLGKNKRFMDLLKSV